MQLFYDDVFNVVFDNYGKLYEIKEGKGKWFYVNYNISKISVSTLPKKYFINDFDDVITHYALMWNRTHPCHAIAFLSLKKYHQSNGKKYNIQNYLAENRINKNTIFA